MTARLCHVQINIFPDLLIIVLSGSIAGSANVMGMLLIGYIGRAEVLARGNPELHLLVQ
jgi:hypothetical protein